ncbi:hypothetical protein HDV01_004566 [Terramyces sp. JEL0728]|nr:hypothetical protein HDV01_004566 [Terramyces sp. JEL0728]
MTDLNELSEKVRRHLESSNNISILHEFCQKTQKALPEWKPTSETKTGTYTHGMQLVLMGQRFECSGAASKQEAKKIVAGAAIEYFEKQGVPYFVHRPKNYISLLFTLCAQAGVEPPQYTYRDVEKAFGCTISVQNRTFTTPFTYNKKSIAKEVCSQLAFESISNDPLISERVLMNAPGAVAKKKEKSVKIEQVFSPKKDNSIYQQSDRQTFYNNYQLYDSDLMMNAMTLQSEVTPFHVKPQEEEILSFADILWAYYETNPAIGMPYYNHRPIKSPDGETKYRAQLIMGAKNKVSQPHPVQADATNEVAQEMYRELIRIIPDANATPAVMDALAYPNSKSAKIPTPQPSSLLPILNPSYYNRNSDPRLHTKRGFPDEDGLPPKHLPTKFKSDAYYSDEDEIIKSYEVMLRAELQKRGLSPAEFKYNPGTLGIWCTGVFYTKDGQPKAMTTLREHKHEATAREDISHDLFVVLLSLPI